MQSPNYSTSFTGAATLSRSADSPAFRCQSHQQMARAWQLVRDVYAGTLTLRDKASVYLPQMPAEDKESYRARIDNSELFNCFKKTVQGLVGLVFAKDPEPAADCAEQIKTLFEDVNLEGDHLSVFAKELFQDAMRDGHAFILVEMQGAVAAAGAGAATLADERAAGLRPYLVKYTADQAVNWRTELRGGRRVLTQITFEEITTDTDGEFGERTCVQYRVLRPGSGQVFRQEKQKDRNGRATGRTMLVADEPYAVKGFDGRPLTEIPLAVCYGERTGFLCSAPPLLDQAVANVKHFRMTSDLDNIIHIANVPIMWARGRDTSKEFQPVGPTILIDLEGEHAELGYAEVTASGLKNTQEEIDRKERRMAVMGLDMLTERDGRATTATEYTGNMAQSTSALSTAARSLGDCLETAAGHLAVFLGLERPAGGSITLNISWNRLVLSPDKMRTLLEFKKENCLDTETILELLKRAGELPDDIDIRLVLERLFGVGLLDGSEVERSVAAAASLIESSTPERDADDDDEGETSAPESEEDE